MIPFPYRAIDTRTGRIAVFEEQEIGSILVGKYEDTGEEAQASLFDLEQFWEAA